MADNDAKTGIVVQKYGGSSVSDVEGIHQVARRVAAAVAAGLKVVVVVSAMGNTTNELLALAQAVSRSPGRRELDLLVSVGERVSMTLLAMAIEDLGIPAASFTGSQSGIITDTNHVSARVLEVRPQRVRGALDQGRVAIVAGFQGVSRHGEVTTLGRGGSDTTAVVLAAALGADWCELCSDVDGVFTADPRVVPGARRLDTLPLDAAVSLSRAGAKVLHAQAVELARELGVELHAAATGRPSGTGTRLPPGPAPAAAVGISVDDQLFRVSLDCIPDDVGDALRLVWSQDGRGVGLLDGRNLHGIALVGGRPVAAVTAVGRHVVQDPATVRRALAAVAHVKVEHWQAAGEQLTLVVDRASAAVVAQALHGALVPDTPGD